MLKAGLKEKCEMVVSAENTAEAMKSGTLQVLATPSMVALMEEAAWKAVQPELDEGSVTVGTAMNIEHLSATPVGMKIWAEAELTAVEGRKLSFTVEAYDEAGLIGKGVHERFIVFAQKFQEKTDKKGK